MNGGRLLIGAFVIMLAGTGAYLGYRHSYIGNQKCSMCARTIYPKLAADAVFTNGSRVRTCCARCVIHLGLHNPGRIAALRVSDVESGEMIPADSASYVEGSSAQECHPDPAADETHQVREAGVLYDLAYDRCIPLLLAFKSGPAAKEFRKQYGGRVLTYSEARESVRQR
jgi:hypothetical protein